MWILTLEAMLAVTNFVQFYMFNILLFYCYGGWQTIESVKPEEFCV